MRSLQLAALFAIATISLAQTSTAPASATSIRNSSASQTPSALAAQVPAPRPDDVKSPEAIVTACYDVISGPAGDRNWDRFRSLFVPDARLIPVWSMIAAGVAFAVVEYYWWFILPAQRHHPPAPLGLRVYFNLSW